MNDMHEMALMGDILQLVEKDAQQKGLEKIVSIELLVGQISNVMPDALTMAFAIIKEQNPHFFTKDAELFIRHEEAQAECTICGQIYKPSQKIALCPNCQFPSGKIVCGEAFEILSYEGRK